MMAFTDTPMYRFYECLLTSQIIHEAEDSSGHLFKLGQPPYSFMSFSSCTPVPAVLQHVRSTTC